MPALGTTEIGRREWRDSVRTCSRMSVGPVAQFMPSTSMSSGSSAAIAARGSVPSSMVLMSFSTVNCKGGRPANTSLHAATAALIWSRSKQVSTSRTSQPPSSSPRTWRR